MYIIWCMVMGYLRDYLIIATEREEAEGGEE